MSTSNSVMVLIVSRQMITTLGVSGNASVVNIGGDNITHIYGGIGADTYAVFDSIDRRLKVVQAEKLGMFALAFLTPL